MISAADKVLMLALECLMCIFIPFSDKKRKHDEGNQKEELHGKKKKSMKKFDKKGKFGKKV